MGWEAIAAIVAALALLGGVFMSTSMTTQRAPSASAPASATPPASAPSANTRSEPTAGAAAAEAAMGPWPGHQMGYL